MKIIALMSKKGGSGKSTLAGNLAVEAALSGHQILIVDLDEQATVYEWYKDRPSEKKHTHPFFSKSNLNNSRKFLKD